MRSFPIRNIVPLWVFPVFFAVMFAAEGFGQVVPGPLKEKSVRNIATHVRIARPDIDVPPGAIIVQPGNRVFPTLQRALDASRTGSRVHLGPGTYVGNWNLSSGITIWGSGPGETILVGSAGVVQPTLTYEPSGAGAGNWCRLMSMTVVGREVAAVAYNGINTEALFELWDIKLKTMGANSIPGIKVAGSGFDNERKLALEFEGCEFYSSQGAGIEVDAGRFIDIDIGYVRKTSVAKAVVDASFSDRNGTSISVYESNLSQCQNGIKTYNLENLEIKYSQIVANGAAIELSNTDAVARHDEFVSPVTCVNVLNGSNFRIAYCQFNDCTTPISTDGTSVTKMAFCHRDFVEL